MKVKNKKTGVIKTLKTESDVAMYLATNEWELVKEIKPSKFGSNKDKSEE